MPKPNDEASALASADAMPDWLWIDRDQCCSCAMWPIRGDIWVDSDAALTWPRVLCRVCAGDPLRSQPLAYAKKLVHDQSPVHQAVGRGDLDELTSLLASAPRSKSVQTADGWSAVHVAAAHGRVDVLRVLKATYRLDSASSTHTGLLPVHIAAACGHVDVLRWLVEEQMESLRARTYPLRLSVFDLAAHGGHIDVLEWCVGKVGEEMLWSRTANGKSPMMYAVKRGSLKLVQWLEKRIPEGQEEQVWGQVDEQGTSLLMWACAGGGDVNLVEYVHTRQPEDAAGINNMENGPMYFAALAGRTDVVQWLVSNGYANVTDAMQHGNTAAHVAAREGHLPLLRWIIDDAHAGASPTNAKGLTPAMLAALRGHVGILQYYMTSHRTALAVVDRDGCYCSHYAALAGRLSVLRLLSQDKPTLLLDQCDSINHSPVFYAAAAGHLDVVRYLVDGAYHHVTEVSDAGKTMLHIAALHGHAAVVEWALGLPGVDANATDRSGNTILACAASRGNRDLVRRLLDLGIGIDYMLFKVGKTVLFAPVCNLIWRMRNLRTLMLTQVALSGLPNGIGALKKLRSLDLAGNKLVSLPVDVELLTSLVHLNLNGNRFTSIPDMLVSLERLVILDIGRNPIEGFSAVVEPACIQAVRSLQDLAASSIQLHRMRVPPDTVPGPVAKILRRTPDALCRTCGTDAGASPVLLTAMKVLLMQSNEVVPVTTTLHSSCYRAHEWASWMTTPEILPAERQLWINSLCAATAQTVCDMALGCLDEDLADV